MGEFQIVRRPTLCSLLLLLLLVIHPFHPKCIVSASAQTPIKTIVILVMENRSFDHMLGWMKRSINPNINGVTGNECNPRSTTDPQSPVICVSDDAQYVDPDPGHSFQEIKQQVFGSSNIPTMTGFVQQGLNLSTDIGEAVMKGFKPEAVPVYASLVSEFALIDRWFSALPTSTQSNRLYLYSATSHGLLSNDQKILLSGLPQKTIFDSLHDQGLDFGIYFQQIPSTLYYRSLRKLKYVTKFHEFDLEFKKHASKGELPSLTVIEPRYFDVKISPANDDHPSHDVANGQRLVKEVYETLRASPQWNQTLFLITYDEHGGFYDHVVTPYTGIPNPDGINSDPYFNFTFDRLGVRVPAILVSPWIKKGTVISGPNGPTPNSEFEHSSIPATIKKIFNLEADFLTHRDAWAGTFEGVVGELTSPRTDCPEVLPDVNSLRNSEADEGKKLTEFQKEIVELAAVLNGDCKLNGFPDEMINRMTVKEAYSYVTSAISRFLETGRKAIELGADESTIVDMKPSLTSRKLMT